MSKRLSLMSIFIGGMLFSLVTLAAIDTWSFESPEQKARYSVLTKELRCPKCDGQSIGDSNAPIANDLRGVIYNQLQDGMSDDQIVDFMVDRYGEFVLYRPKVEGKTLWLWYGPVVFGLIGLLALIVIIIRSRRNSYSEPEPALDDAERQRLSALMTSCSDDKERGV